jgi:hypothetical protein
MAEHVANSRIAHIAVPKTLREFITFPLYRMMIKNNIELHNTMG